MALASTMPQPPTLAEDVDPKLNRMVAAQLNKTKMCSMFQRGTCQDPRCRFAHSKSELRVAPDLTKTAMCRAFARGQCNDPKCKFAHGETELRVTNAVYKTQICNFHARGHCKKGDRCRHAHGSTELRPFTGPSGEAGSGGDEVQATETPCAAPLLPGAVTPGSAAIGGARGMSNRLNYGSEAAVITNSHLQQQQHQKQQQQQQHQKHQHSKMQRDLAWEQIIDTLGAVAPTGDTAAVQYWVSQLKALKESEMNNSPSDSPVKITPSAPFASSQAPPPMVYSAPTAAPPPMPAGLGYETELVRTDGGEQYVAALDARAAAAAFAAEAQRHSAAAQAMSMAAMAAASVQVGTATPSRFFGYEFHGGSPTKIGLTPEALTHGDPMAVQLVTPPHRNPVETSFGSTPQRIAKQPTLLPPVPAPPGQMLSKDRRGMPTTIPGIQTAAAMAMAAPGLLPPTAASAWVL